MFLYRNDLPKIIAFFYYFIYNIHKEKKKVKYVKRTHVLDFGLNILYTRNRIYVPTAYSREVHNE